MGDLLFGVVTGLLVGGFVITRYFTSQQEVYTNFVKNLTIEEFKDKLMRRSGYITKNNCGVTVTDINIVFHEMRFANLYERRNTACTHYKYFDEYL